MPVWCQVWGPELPGFADRNPERISKHYVKVNLTAIKLEKEFVLQNKRQKT